MIASGLAFTLSGSAAKFIGVKLPPVELAFLRSAFGMIIVVVAWRAIIALRALRDPIWHAVRGGLGVTALFCLMAAFANLPLALVFATLAARTFLLIFLAAVFCGERATRTLWAASCIGVSGVIIIALWPQIRMAFGNDLEISTSALGAIAAIGAALSSAGSQLAVRRLTDSNSPSVIVIVFTLVSTTFLGFPALGSWVVPNQTDWFVISLLGIFAVGAQWCAARSYSHIGAARAAPIDLMQIPISTVIGWQLFGEVPGLLPIVGALMIMASTIWVASTAAE